MPRTPHHHRHCLQACIAIFLLYIQQTQSASAVHMIQAAKPAYDVLRAEIKRVLNSQNPLARQALFLIGEADDSPLTFVSKTSQTEETRPLHTESKARSYMSINLGARVQFIYVLMIEVFDGHVLVRNNVTNKVQHEERAINDRKFLIID